MLVPTDELSIERARQLVAERCVQTSNKYRHVSRLFVPEVRDVLKAQYHDTWIEQELIKFFTRSRESFARDYGESLTLTVNEFQAFKLIKSGRL